MKRLLVAGAVCTFAATVVSVEYQYRDYALPPGWMDWISLVR